jgi:glycosyltransferase involved in cell wall biosynthesis
MRIAMVGPFGFHPNKTMRSRALQLAKSLVRRDHLVKIFMPPWHTPQEAGRNWQEEGVGIAYTALNGGTMGIASRLQRATMAWRPDVVHAFKPKAYSGLVAWWLWTFHRNSVRLVVDTDDWEGWGGWNDLAPYSSVQKRFFAWQERWGLRHNHALTVASRTLQSLAWSNGTPAENVFYLPNGPGISDGADRADQMRSDLGLSQRPVVLIYSRLFEFETEHLVNILRIVHSKMPDLAVLLVGKGLYEDDAAIFAEKIKAAGLQDAIVETGWVEEAELPHVLAAADVGLYLMEDTLLNRTKCPVKLADMLNVGIPVVAEDVGQVKEYVIHLHTGLLYPAGDVDNLAGGLLEMLQKEGKRKQMGQGAREHIAEKFSWERLAEIAEGAYFGT